MMLSIPARLMDPPIVQILYQGEQGILLKKELFEPALERHSFISMPVIAWVKEGLQRLQTYDGDETILNAGTLAVYRKGIYTINDLVNQEGAFRSYLLFLKHEKLREVLARHVRGGRPLPALEPIRQTGCPTLIQDFFRQVDKQSTVLKEPTPEWI